MSKDILTVKWLGINSFAFRFGGKVILLDPCVTRGDSAMLSDPALVKKYVPEADVIFVSHSHWDHLADVPEIVRNTGAHVYGSETTAFILRYYQIPEENIHVIRAGDKVRLDHGLTVDVIESRHMKLAPDWTESFLHDVPSQIAVRTDMPSGDVFALHFHFGEIDLLNLGSANMHPPAIHGVATDYFFCGISRYKDGFPQMVREHIAFKTFVPTHHDDFKTRPLTDFVLRNDLERFTAEYHGLRCLELPPLREIKLEILNHR